MGPRIRIITSGVFLMLLALGGGILWTITWSEKSRCSDDCDLMIMTPDGETYTSVIEYLNVGDCDRVRRALARRSSRLPYFVHWSYAVHYQFGVCLRQDDLSAFLSATLAAEEEHGTDVLPLLAVYHVGGIGTPANIDAAKSRLSEYIGFHGISSILEFRERAILPGQMSALSDDLIAGAIALAQEISGAPLSVLTQIARTRWHGDGLAWNDRSVFRVMNARVREMMREADIGPDLIEAAYLVGWFNANNKHRMAPRHEMIGEENDLILWAAERGHVAAMHAIAMGFLDRGGPYASNPSRAVRFINCAVARGMGSASQQSRIIARAKEVNRNADLTDSCD